MRLLLATSLPTFVVETRQEAERQIALEIAEILAREPEAALGLATGDTPIGVYGELVRLYEASRVSFARAWTFNLDEYLDLAGREAHSFRAWMHTHLFQHVDLREDRAHLPEFAPRDASAAADRYEAALRGAGGLAVQLLGIGRNGHIGFNEPGSSKDSRTRVVELHETTREDAVKVFGRLESVPTRAITMGVATILDARRIRVLAFGAHKAAIVRATLLGPEDSAIPATFLRGHPDVRLYLDPAAATALEP